MPITRVISYLQSLQIPSLEIYKNQQAYHDQFNSDSDEAEWIDHSKKEQMDKNNFSVIRVGVIYEYF